MCRPMQLARRNILENEATRSIRCAVQLDRYIGAPSQRGLLCFKLCLYGWRQCIPRDTAVSTDCCSCWSDCTLKPLVARET